VAKAPKGKKAEGGAMVETDNNDPLFGL
jgi:hypothetical protein